MNNKAIVLEKLLETNTNIYKEKHRAKKFVKTPMEAFVSKNSAQQIFGKHTNDHPSSKSNQAKRQSMPFLSNCEKIQSQAKQSLLDLDLQVEDEYKNYDHFESFGSSKYHSQGHTRQNFHRQTKAKEISNPQKTFMRLTRNIKLNSFRTVDDAKHQQQLSDENFDDLVFGEKRSQTIQQQQQASFLKKNQGRSLRKTKNSLKCIWSVNDDQAGKGLRFEKKILPEEKAENIFAQTKSNLLNPRKSFMPTTSRENLPNIYNSTIRHKKQSSIVGLTSREKETLQPYSSTNRFLHNNEEGPKKILKISVCPSVTKLREQLNLFPSFQKEVRRKKLTGGGYY